MLKMGTIGAGFVTRFHVRTLRSVRIAEFTTGVYTLKGAESLAQFARQDRLGGSGKSHAYGLCVCHPGRTPLVGQVIAV